VWQTGRRSSWGNPKRQSRAGYQDKEKIKNKKRRKVKITPKKLAWPCTGEKGRRAPGRQNRRKTAHKRGILKGGRRRIRNLGLPKTGALQEG